MWIFLSVLAVVSLLAFFSTGGPNAVWGGATVGLIVGVIIAAMRDGFEWSVVWKAIVIGILCGAIAEVLSMISRRTAQNIDGS